jgi:hypothetical protein
LYSWEILDLDTVVTIHYICIKLSCKCHLLKTNTEQLYKSMRASTMAIAHTVSKSNISQLHNPNCQNQTDPRPIGSNSIFPNN